MSDYTHVLLLTAEQAAAPEDVQKPSTHRWLNDEELGGFYPCRCGVVRYRAKPEDEPCPFWTLPLLALDDVLDGWVVHGRDGDWHAYCPKRSVEFLEASSFPELLKKIAGEAP